MTEDIKGMLPEQNAFLWGHEEAEAEMLKAAQSGRLHHAWLITGPRGIGKATLAYRFARWLLAGGSEAKEEAQDGLFGDMLPSIPSAEGLAVDENEQAFAQVAAGSHPDLLVLNQENSDTKTKENISVESVRKVGSFLALTPAQSKWRIVVVDDADSLNRNAANALLKLLEEPPANAILLLVSHTPGKLLPTIRSRCRTLKLRGLEENVLRRVVAHFMPEREAEDMQFAKTLAEGSPGVALSLLNSNAREIYDRLLQLFGRLPELSISESLLLAQAVSGKNEAEQWQIFSYLLQYLITTTVRGKVTGEWGEDAVEGESVIKKAISENASLDKWVDLWEKIGNDFADVQRINMDKRHNALCMLEAFRSMAA